MGVVVGVFAMVVVLSVMNGFGEVVRGLLVDLDPHIRIVSAEKRGFERADSLQAKLATLDHVVSTSAYLEGKALLVRGGGVDANRIVLVRGVDQEQLAGVSSVVDQTAIGEFDVKREDGRAGNCYWVPIGAGIVIVYRSRVWVCSQAVGIWGPARCSCYQLLASSG